MAVSGLPGGSKTGGSSDPAPAGPDLPVGALRAVGSGLSGPHRVGSFTTPQSVKSELPRHSRYHGICIGASRTESRSGDYPPVTNVTGARAILRIRST